MLSLTLKNISLRPCGKQIRGRQEGVNKGAGLGTTTVRRPVNGSSGGEEGGLWGHTEKMDAGSILEKEPRGLGDGLEMGGEGAILDKEAEIEIIHRPLGKVVFEKETKREGAIDSRA